MAPGVGATQAANRITVAVLNAGMRMSHSSRTRWWVRRLIATPVYSTVGSEFRGSEHEARAQVDPRALGAPRHRHRQRVGAAGPPGGPQPAPGPRAPPLPPVTSHADSP